MPVLCILALPLEFGHIVPEVVDLLFEKPNSQHSARGLRLFSTGNGLPSLVLYNIMRKEKEKKKVCWLDVRVKEAGQLLGLGTISLLPRCFEMQHFELLVTTTTLLLTPHSTTPEHHARYQSPVKS